MQKINFNYITLKNFMKYGNKPQTLHFTKGLWAILARNGGGKSSIFYALHYALYGKTYNGRLLKSLVNNINKSDMLVELEFSINQDTYLIKRGISPNVFEIYKNSKLIPIVGTNEAYQKQLDQILQIPETAFKNLIYLGNDLLSQSFLKMSKADKEKLFSILSDTEILLKLQASIKDKKKESLTNLTNQKYVVNVLQSNYNKILQEFKEQLERYNKTTQLDINDKIKEIDNKLLELEDKFSIARKLKESYQAIILPKQPDYHKIQEMEYALKNMSKFEGCKGCPKLSNLIKIVDENEYKTLKQEANEFEAIKADKDKLYNELTQYSSLPQMRDNLLKMKETILNMQEASKPDDSSVRTTKAELDKENEKLDTLQEQHNQVEKLEKLLFSQELRDVLLESQLPHINYKINEYMNYFDNNEFSFELDYNLKETIKHRNKEYEYKQMSNGELLRLTLSIMLTMNYMLRNKFGVSCNLLVLDEVLDSSLDITARHTMLNILRNEFKDDSVYLITHNTELKDINAVRVKGDKFSELEIEC